MASTISEIKRIKKILDELRLQYRKAASDGERTLLQKRIDYHLNVLEMLGG